MLSGAFSSKVTISILFFIITLVVGFVLHKKGKPYNSLIFNLHKLASVAMVILLVLELSGFIRVTEVNALFIICLMLSGFFTLVLFLTGAMMSLDKLQEIMRIIHRASSVLLLLTLPVLIYFICVRQ